MSDSEDMTEFASIVERIERGEVSECPPGESALPVTAAAARQRATTTAAPAPAEGRDADNPGARMHI